MPSFEQQQQRQHEQHLHELATDPDVLEESVALARVVTRLAIGPTPAAAAAKPSDPSPSPSTPATPQPLRHVPLVVHGNTYQTTPATAQLLREIGGGDAVRRMTSLFYEKAFRDASLDKFIVDHADPHGDRLGNWIVEKMGGEGPVWSQERAVRSQCPVSRQLSNGKTTVVHDRSSAHGAAWWSPKRPSHEAGRTFQVHEARVWMRLMFWSARELGLFALSPSFESWYVRFIAHFMRVYEQRAPPFARESARWSETPANLAAYAAAGCSMGAAVLGRDGDGLPHKEAVRQLPQHEAELNGWPYER